MLNQILKEFSYRWRSRQPKWRWRVYSESKIAANFREGLLGFYQELLDEVPWQSDSKFVRVIDIGVKNFGYVSALSAWLSQRATLSQIDLLGLEVDPGRLYVDLFRRRDYAEYYVREANEKWPQIKARFESGDWLRYELADKVDLIFCFYPFLFEDLNSRWGLPRRFFNPLDFYKKCARHGRQMVFVHQGLEEKEESLRLLQEIGAQILFTKELKTSRSMPRKHPSWVISWRAQSL